MTLLPLAGWYMKRSFLNSFKRHKVMFIAIILFFVGLIVLTNYAAKKDAEKAELAISQEGQKPKDKIPEYAEKDKLYDADEGWFIGVDNGEVRELTPVVIEGVCLLLVLAVVGMSFATGAKSGASFFSMADVNFLFPSPHKPQAVLSFKMVTQVAMALLGSYFLVYQYPNLVSKDLLSPLSFILCLLLYMSLAVMNNFVSLASYLLFYKHPKIRPMVSKIVLVVCAVPVLIFAFLAFVLKIGIYRSLSFVCTSIGSRLIPFVGWMKTSFAMIIKGEYLWALLFFAITVVFCFLLLKWIFSRDVDFYEDSLDFAMVREETLARIKDRKKGMANASYKSKESIEKKSNKIRDKKISFDRSPGAKAFFTKNLRNRMRQSRLKGLLAGSLVFNLLVSGILFYLYKKIVDSATPEEPIPASFSLIFCLIILMVFAFILFFRSRTNPLQLDMNVNFIYMIPESMPSILLYSYAEYILEGLVDLSPALVLMYLVSGDVLLSLCCFALLLIYFVYISLCGLALNCIFRVYIAQLLMSILSMILAGAPFFILYKLSSKLLHSELYFVLGFTAWLLLALSIVFFIICSKLLRRGKQ